ncbi:MAG: GatB/YqeY domain-containing protein [Betaproteobacteria bacterium]
MSLKTRVTEDMKAAMRAKDTARLGTVRLLLAAMKQKEVDERLVLSGTELTDADVLAIIDKMVKQRRESIAQYEKAARNDLADVEKAEIAVLAGYLPQQLTEAEVAAAIAAAIAEAGAAGAKDMGKVMGLLKPRLAGRTDMGKVSGLVKAKLAG